jgi:hypothetical protein
MYRMNSKISMLSKKRQGIKGKIEQVSNKMAGAELNIQKLLEDVWGKFAILIKNHINQLLTEFRTQNSRKTTH